VDTIDILTRLTRVKELSNELWHNGKYDSALICASEAAAKADSTALDSDKGKKQKILKIESDIFNNMGISYWYKSKTAKDSLSKATWLNLSLKIFWSALKIKEDSLPDGKTTGSKKDIANTYNNIGLVYYSLGNAALDSNDKAGSRKMYYKALQNYFKALYLLQDTLNSKKVGDEQSITSVRHNIGNTYNNQRNYYEARKYLNPIKEVKIYPKEVISIGAGLGLDYGGLGANLLYYPQKNTGIFIGVGYAVIGTGYNAGVKLRLFPSVKEYANVNPFVTAMYGYHAFLDVTNATQYNKIFYGYTVGLGVDIRRKRGCWTVAVLFPLKSSEVYNYTNELRLSQGNFINPTNTLYPLMPSIGYKFRLY